MCSSDLDGMTIEEMTETIAAIENPTDAQAELLLRAEKTDMFEQLVSGNEGKATMITAIIDRHVRSQNPEDDAEDATENEDSNVDLDDFYIKDCGDYSRTGSQIIVGHIFCNFPILSTILSISAISFDRCFLISTRIFPRKCVANSFCGILFSTNAFAFSAQSFPNSESCKCCLFNLSNFGK